MRYGGRPGLSPAVAVLVAAGRIAPAHAILDVGCGTGTDVLTLAQWGFRRLTGIDPDRGAIGAARTRAARLGLARRAAFEPLAGEDALERFGPHRFDVVLHTLVANNLDRRLGDHFRSLAGVLKPDGLLVLHERMGLRHEREARGHVAPLAAVRRHFALSRSVTTHLAERRRQGGPGYAPVALWTGRPRPPKRGSGRVPPA